MKNNFELNYDLELKKNVSEITSISIDVDYDTFGNKVSGEFEIEGTYKSHGLSLNQDEFTKTIPFEHNLETGIDESSIKLEITNFTYEINANTLCVSIEYTISYNKIIEEYDDLEEFNRFLDEHEVDIVNLETELTPEIVEEVILPEPEKLEEEKELTLFNGEEHFITYHIYICTEQDTLESISARYNISIEEIKEYNETTEIKLGTKLILPISNE